MREEVYICTYEHKHGEDTSVHWTMEGAEAYLRQLARENLEEWGEDIARYGDDVDVWNKVWRNWHDIAGMTEFMRIEVHKVH